MTRPNPATPPSPADPKFVKFAYQVRVTVDLCRADLDYLIQVAERHYDFVCKSFALEGGLLYGWRNYFEGRDNERTSWDLTVRDLDVIAKILEQSPGMHLYFPFRRLLIDAIAEQERANAPAVSSDPASKIDPPA